MKADFLRKKYPKFIYKSFDYKVVNGDLKIVFNFSIEPDGSMGHSTLRVSDSKSSPQVINFKPKIIIENIDKKKMGRMRDGALGNLIFHLGLIEIPSYWKTTCSPKIEIRAGCLNAEQIKWWKNLIIEGMGQFYYENKIDWRQPDFLKITSLRTTDVRKVCGQPTSAKLKNRYLVPFAGGRDSIVTLESLKKKFPDWNEKIALFTVNPIAKIQKTVKVTGIKNQIIVKRIIDKKLLELNKKGYLNGHTPFTALLSFISVLCAVIFDYKDIAFSNEKSANEGNVKYLGKTINHQWTKSSEFEKRFSEYAKKYLVKDLNYFSYLRKYGELKISKMLIKYPQYFPVFSSCNAGMRIRPAFASPKPWRRRASSKLRRGEARWCGNCPKCLFVYMSLYPFLEKEKLLQIFGKDIFENRKLLPTMRQLVERGELKPFECVGTKRESKKALALCIKKAQKERKIPYLLSIDLRF